MGWCETGAFKYNYYWIKKNRALILQIKGLLMVSLSKIKVAFLLSSILICFNSSINNKVLKDTTKVSQTDTIIATRPLPKWLIDQRNGQTARQAQPHDVLKKDNSIIVSVSFTGMAMLLIVTIVSIFIFKRKKRWGMIIIKLMFMES